MAAVTDQENLPVVSPELGKYLHGIGASEPPSISIDPQAPPQQRLMQGLQQGGIPVLAPDGRPGFVHQSGIDSFLKTNPTYKLGTVMTAPDGRPGVVAREQAATFLKANPDYKVGQPTTSTEAVLSNPRLNETFPQMVERTVNQPFTEDTQAVLNAPWWKRPAVEIGQQYNLLKNPAVRAAGNLVTEGGQKLADLIGYSWEQVPPETPSGKFAKKYVEPYLKPAGEAAATDILAPMAQPESIAMMGGFQAAPQIAGPAGRALRVGTGAGFGIPALRAAIEGGRQALQSAQQGDTEGMVHAGTGALFNAALAGSMLHGAAQETPELAREAGRALVEQTPTRLAQHLPENWLTPEQQVGVDVRQTQKRASNLAAALATGGQPAKSVRAYEDIGLPIIDDFRAEAARQGKTKGDFEGRNGYVAAKEVTTGVRQNYDQAYNSLIDPLRPEYAGNAAQQAAQEVVNKMVGDSTLMDEIQRGDPTGRNVEQLKNVANVIAQARTVGELDDARIALNRLAAKYEGRTEGQQYLSPLTQETLHEGANSIRNALYSDMEQRYAGMETPITEGEIRELQKKHGAAIQADDLMQQTARSLSGASSESVAKPTWWQRVRGTAAPLEAAGRPKMAATRFLQSVGFSPPDPTELFNTRMQRVIKGASPEEGSVFPQPPVTPEYVEPRSEGPTASRVPPLGLPPAPQTAQAQEVPFWLSRTRELPPAQRMYGVPEEPIVDLAEQNREYGQSVTPLGPTGQAGRLVRAKRLPGTITPDIVPSSGNAIEGQYIQPKGRGILGLLRAPAREMGPGTENPAELLNFIQRRPDLFPAPPQAGQPPAIPSQAQPPVTRVEAAPVVAPAAPEPTKPEAPAQEIITPSSQLEQIKAELRAQYPGNSEERITQAAKEQLAFNNAAEQKQAENIQNKIFGKPEAPAAPPKEPTKIPQVTSDRTAKKAIQVTDDLLVRRAIEKAQAQNDDFNLTQFQNINPKKLTPAERDNLNVYLFGDTEGRPAEELLAKPAAPARQEAVAAPEAKPSAPASGSPEYESLKARVAELERKAGKKAEVAAVPKGIPATASGKKPWELTYPEFYDYFNDGGGKGSGYSFAEHVGKPLGIKSQGGSPTTPEGVGYSENLPEGRWRLAVIEAALRRGETVPPEVLGEYPDLARKYGKGPVVERTPQMTDQLRKLADELITLDNEKQPTGSKSTPEQWENYRSQAMWTHIYPALAGEVKEGAGWEKTRLETVKEKLAAAGFTGTAPIRQLIDARKAEIAAQKPSVQPEKAGATARPEAIQQAEESGRRAGQLRRSGDDSFARDIIAGNSKYVSTQPEAVRKELVAAFNRAYQEEANAPIAKAKIPTRAEVSRLEQEYGATASRSTNPDIDLAVSRARGRWQEAQSAYEASQKSKRIQAEVKTANKQAEKVSANASALSVLNKMRTTIFGRARIIEDLTEQQAKDILAMKPEDRPVSLESHEIARLEDKAGVRQPTLEEKAANQIALGKTAKIEPPTAVPEAGKNFEGRYVRAALEPVKEAWLKKLPAKEDETAEENWKWMIKQSQGLASHPPAEYAKGSVFVKVPNDGSFLIPNTPAAIDHALKSADRFALGKGDTGEAKRTRFRTPTPTESDVQKYIKGLETEIESSENALKAKALAEEWQKDISNLKAASSDELLTDKQKTELEDLERQRSWREPDLAVDRGDLEERIRVAKETIQQMRDESPAKHFLTKLTAKGSK